MGIRKLVIVLLMLSLTLTIWAPGVLAAPVISDAEPLGGEMIVKASSDITGSGQKIEGIAFTRASNLCSKIGALFTLQKWNGSKWENYKTASKYLSNVALTNAIVSFSAGAGTYRLKVNHRLYSDSTLKASLTTITRSISIP